MTIRNCSGCGLLYRPTGWKGGLILKLYYSFIYANAGIATDQDRFTDKAKLAADVAGEGKDRSGIILEALKGKPPKRLCVFGCSWGYELLPLLEISTDVFGIELSDPRRELANKQLGLSVFEDARKAARVGGPAEVVLSSHVLEHIPQLETVLDEIQGQLKPRISIHIAPDVDRKISGVRQCDSVGREHPVGVSLEFWRGYAARRGLSLESFLIGEPETLGQVERVAVLRVSNGD